MRSTAEHLAGGRRRPIDDPLERLHGFLVEYYRICQPGAEGQAGREARPAPAHGRVRPAAAHRAPARRPPGPSCRSSTLLEQLLDEAAAAGAIRPGLNHRRIAGVLLQAIMFNAFAATISGVVAARRRRTAADELWDLVLDGIGPE